VVTVRARRGVDLAIALMLASPQARAQGPDPVAAEALFVEGRKDMENGNYARACPKFAESQRLDPAPGTLLNLADCEEKVGALASAWQHLRQLADQLPQSDERRAVILARAKAMDQRVPRLVILPPERPIPGLKVTRDGVELGAAAFGVPLPANPGEHVVVVTAPGRPENKTKVTLAEGVTKTLRAEPGALEAPEEPAVEPEPRSSPATKRAVGWVVGGLGVVALGAGTGFGIAALSKKSDSDAFCKDTPCSSEQGRLAFDDAKSRARASDILIGTGVAMVGVAVFLIVTAKDDPATATSRAARWVGASW
jgi:hypothetical protein